MLSSTELQQKEKEVWVQTQIIQDFHSTHQKLREVQNS